MYQQIEIEHGPFRREIQLGVDVVAAQASATYEDGILRVELPVAKPCRPPGADLGASDDDGPADS